MRAFAAVLAVSLVVPLATLSAQEPPPVQPGARVRLTVPNIGTTRLVGPVLAVEAVRCQLAISLMPSTGSTVARSPKPTVLRYGTLGRDNSGSPTLRRLG